MSITQARDENGNMKDVASTMSSVASNIGHEVNRGAKELGRASTVIVKDLEERGSAALDQIGKTATDATKSLENEIKSSPLISIGIAFGLGLVAARLLRHS